MEIPSVSAAGYLPELYTNRVYREPQAKQVDPVSVCFELMLSQVFKTQTGGVFEGYSSAYTGMFVEQMAHEFALNQKAEDVNQAVNFSKLSE